MLWPKSKWWLIQWQKLIRILIDWQPVLEEKNYIVLYNLCSGYSIGQIVKTFDIPFINKLNSFKIFVSLQI